MSSGYIRKVYFDNFDIEAYAARHMAAHDLYLPEIRRACADLENCHDDVVNHSVRVTFRCDDPDAMVVFANKDLPSGAYDLHLRYRKWVDHSEDDPLFDGLPPLHKSAVEGCFSAAGSNEVFYRYEFDTVRIRNALWRYEGIVKQFRDEADDLLRVPRRANLNALVRNDLEREEGHKGIAAQLFPQQYNQHIRTSLFIEGNDPPLQVNLGLACRIFDLLRTLFPRQTWDPDLGVGGFLDLPERPSSVVLLPSAQTGVGAPSVA